MGAQRIIGIDLWRMRSMRNLKTNTRTVLERTYDILMSNLSLYQEKEYGKEVMILRPDIGHRLNTFSFHYAKKFLTAGEKIVASDIEKIKEFVK